MVYEVLMNNCFLQANLRDELLEDATAAREGEQYY
jgi:hypothetical protein